jgi:chemotaxis protein MotB
MRLDEGMEDQKLALDITPLIDIIFLLVLFFAVSTSFISGEDLAQLQTDVVTLGDDRVRLTGEVTTRQQAIDTLETDFTRMVQQKTAEIAEAARNLEQSEGKAAQFEFMAGELNKQRINLSTRLTDRETKNESLKNQLNKAFADFQGLNAELTAVRSDAERQAETQRLLRGLLDERERERDALSQEKDELSTGKDALANQLQTLRAFVEDNTSERDAKEAELTASREDISTQLSRTAQAVQALTGKLAAREAELGKSRDSLSDSAAQEVLLQKLLADKAAELDGMQVRIESANAASSDLQKELKTSNEKSTATVAELTNTARTAKTQILRLQAELNKYREVDQLGRDQIEKILQAQEQLREGMSGYLADKSLGIKQEKQRLTLQLSDKILFASGSPNIKREGLNVLRNLGSILKQRMGQLEILIGGHTDNIPVSGRRGPLSDNWGLSAARAVNVVRFFQSEVGIDPKRIAAVGYGANRPVGDNSTAAGRAQNRRIEIVLLPR